MYTFIRDESSSILIIVILVPVILIILIVLVVLVVSSSRVNHSISSILVLSKSRSIFVEDKTILTTKYSSFYL